MKIQIDLTGNVKGIDGLDIFEQEKTVTYGKYAGNILMGAPTEDPLSAFDLGVEFFNTGSASMTIAEALSMRDLILRSQLVTNLVKAPIVRTIDDAVALAKTKKALPKTAK